MLALGSVAKGEATPYSDLEYAFVVELQHEYFTSLAVDSYFRIGNLGETPLSSLDIDELKTPQLSHCNVPTVGFRIDGIKKKAGNIPTGRVGGQSLILTVDEFMELYKTEAETPFKDLAGDKSDMISSSVQIYSNHEGVSSLFLTLKQAISDYEGLSSKPLQLVNRKRLQTLIHDIEKHDYMPEHANLTARNVGFQIKTHLFRYPTLLANNIRCCMTLECQTLWQVFYHLRTFGHISRLAHSCLQIVLALSIYLRIKANVAQRTQTDLVSFYTSCVATDDLIYHVPQNIFLIIGRILIPIKRSIRSLLRKDSLLIADVTNLSNTIILALQEIATSNADFMLDVELLSFIEKYDTALEVLKQGVGGISANFRCSRFIEIIRDKYHTSGSNELEYKFVKLGADVLEANEFFAVAIEFYNWLAASRTSFNNIGQWKIRAAICMVKMKDTLSAQLLVNQAIRLYQKVLRISVDQDIVTHLQCNIAKVNWNDCIHLISAYTILGEISMHRQQCQFEHVRNSLERALVLCGLLISKDECLEKEIGPNFFNSYIRSINIENSSYRTRECLNMLAAIYRNLLQLNYTTGQLRVAVFYAEESLYLIRSLFGANTNHSQTAAIESELAHLYHSLGNLDESLKWSDSTLAMRLALYKEKVKHSCVANSFDKVGDVYQEMGNYQNALAYYQVSLNLRVQKIGINTCYPHIASSYKRLAWLEYRAGNYASATSYMLKTLDIEMEFYGADTTCSEMASNYDFLASIYSAVGNYSSSLKLLEKSRNIYTALYSAQTRHPDLANNSNNLAVLQSRLGNPITALKFHMESLSTYQAVYGKRTSHPSILAQYNNIACAYSQAKNTETALKFHKKSLQMCLDLYGVDASHPCIARSYCNIGGVYSELEDYPNAMKYAAKSLEMRKELYCTSSKHPYMTYSYRLIGKIYAHQANYKLSLENNLISLRMSKALYGETSSNTDIAHCCSDIASVYTTMKDYSTSLKYTLESLNIKLKIYGKDSNHPTVADDYHSMAYSHVMLDDYFTALDYFMKSLNMRIKWCKQHDGLNTMETAPTKMAKVRSAIADCCSDIGELIELIGYRNHAFDWHSQAVMSAESIKASNPMSKALLKLSTSLIEQANYQYASQFLRIAFCKVGSNKLVMYGILRSIGKCYIHLKQWKKSWLCLYLALCGSSSHSDSFELAELHNSISQLLLHLGFLSHSLEHSQRALVLCSNVLDKHSCSKYKRLYTNIRSLRDSLLLVMVCRYVFSATKWSDNV